MDYDLKNLRIIIYTQHLSNLTEFLCETKHHLHRNVTPIFIYLRERFVDKVKKFLGFKHSQIPTIGLTRSSAFREASCFIGHPKALPRRIMIHGRRMNQTTLC